MWRENDVLEHRAAVYGPSEKRLDRSRACSQIIIRVPGGEPQVGADRDHGVRAFDYSGLEPKDQVPKPGLGEVGSPDLGRRQLKCAGRQRVHTPALISRGEFQAATAVNDAVIRGGPN